MTKPEYVISFLAMKCQSFYIFFKAKRYNVNLMNKIQSEPNHFGLFICDLMKKLNIKTKLP